jgi:hypothetical protein
MNISKNHLSEAFPLEGQNPLKCEPLAFRGTVEDIDFEESDFEGITALNTYYKGVHFKGCTFNGTPFFKFVDCTFTDVSFKGISEERYKKDNEEDRRGLFINCKFVNTTFKKVSLAGVRFVDSILENIAIISSSFEAVDFETSTLKNVKFVSCFVKNLLVSSGEKVSFVACKTTANKQKPLTIEFLGERSNSKQKIFSPKLELLDAAENQSYVFAGKGTYGQYVAFQHHRTYSSFYATTFSKFYEKARLDAPQGLHLHEKLKLLDEKDAREKKAFRKKLRKKILGLILIGLSSYLLYSNQEAVLQSIEYLKNLSF